MSRNFLLILTFMAVVSAPDMTVEDVAKYLKLTTRTVHQMISDGRLKAY